MRKKVEIEIDTDLVEEAIRRFHVADAREAVDFALRTLVNDDRDDYDEFSDLSAWQPHRNNAGG